MEISIVIPTYRETLRLQVTLLEILPYLEKKFSSFELIIVDDPDKDGNYTKLQAPFDQDPRITFYRQSQRLGKGAAVKRGCLLGQGEVILFMDADHSTPIIELERFMPHFNSHNDCLVSGVRTYQEDESKWRRVLGLFTQLFLHIVVFKKAVVDSQCGFKAFSRSLVQKIFPLLRVKGGMIDAEIFFLMHKFNYPAFFEPVHWANKPDSKINILVCMINDPIEVIRIRINNFFGVYRAPVISLLKESKP
jgi:dolichyl-phosphate beta-glucosyltransferase